MGAGPNSEGMSTPSDYQDTHQEGRGEEDGGRRVDTPAIKSTEIISVRSDSDSDSDDIQCGLCEHPIIHCSCQPLSIHARLVPTTDAVGGSAVPAFPLRHAGPTIVLHDWTQAEDLNDDTLN